MKGKKYVIECSECGEVMAGYSEKIAIERKKDHQQKFQHKVQVKQKTEELDVDIDQEEIKSKESEEEKEIGLKEAKNRQKTEA